MCRSKAERLVAQAERLAEKLTLVVGQLAIIGNLDTPRGQRWLRAARKADFRVLRREMKLAYREVR